MIIKTEYVIEGLNPDSEWHPVGLAVDPARDYRAQRDDVVRQLRQHGIKRYSHVRLAKYVTEVEIIGEDIRV